ncbi:MAG: gamma-glutamyltransferase, partial [Gemmatimonadaceae bacterium]|nr:gamma-glutamyltransferase [Chitinophagaceae bacterium]
TALVKEGKWKEGDTLIQTELAATLKRIRDGGQKGFYEGETARLIVEEMKRGNGIISLEDLKNYQAKERPATVFPYKGYSIVTMPLPSSGGIIINQTLKMIEKRNIASMGFLSTAAVHLMIEAERRSYADRAEYMGDMDFVKVPLKRMTSSGYVTERMQTFNPEKASSSTDIREGKIKVESEETTHLSVLDHFGNAVAVTTTLNGGYGSKTVVGGAGFLLNNEMDDFSVKPGVANMYGAIGTEANAIAPGKRMLSSMTPTIILKNGKPYAVVGTPGGTTIPTSVFQTIVNLLEFKMSTEDVVNKPKFHHQWLPDEVYVERDFPETVIAKLREMGHKVVLRSAIGRTEVIKRLPDGRIEAVGDKRGDDSAEGY